MCRPYIIVEDGQPRVKQHHIQQLLDGIRNFEVGSVAILLPYSTFHFINSL